jgi:hypothetical protein
MQWNTCCTHMTPSKQVDGGQYGGQNHVLNVKMAANWLVGKVDMQFMFMFMLLRYG